MSSGFKAIAISIALAGLKPCATNADAALAVAQPFRAAALRVCSDPNNMPFSNFRREGFENRIAGLISRELGRTLEYFWLPQRRGFIRNTLRANRCDLVVGVPAQFEMARPTRPYYRSSYVFVSRRDRELNIESLDDPLLHKLKIGIQITGEDYGNPPAAQALASRRIVANVRGFMVYGDNSKPDPQRAVVDAVARGDVDVAIVWGPIAGYYAKQARVPLSLRPVTPDRDGPLLPFAFDIAMAVRRDDGALHDAIDRAIARRAADIRRVLDQYGVPLSVTSVRVGAR